MEGDDHADILEHDIYQNWVYTKVIISIVAPILASYVLASAYVAGEMGILLNIVLMALSTAMTTFATHMLIDASDILIPNQGMLLIYSYQYI